MATHPNGEFEYWQTLEGYGDISSEPSGALDDSLSLLGDEETLHGFMTREDELVRAYDAASNPAHQAQIANQLSQLQNRYHGLRRESVKVRHLVRLGSAVVPTPVSGQ